MPIDTLAIGYTTIQLAEFARGVEFSSYSQDLASFDLEKSVQKKLKDQLKQILDAAAAAAFRTAYVIFQPTSLAGGSWTLTGTPNVTATQNLTVAHMGIIRDYMTDTLWVPFYEDDEYMGILSTKALRGIKNDPDFIEWRKYIQPGDVLYNSEVGKVEQIRCVESPNTAALANNKGTGSVLGEAMIFGEDGVAMIEAETPELRVAIPGDFGRKKAVAWYGILQFGLIWTATSTAGEARVIRVTSQ